METVMEYLAAGVIVGGPAIFFLALALLWSSYR